MHNIHVKRKIFKKCDKKKRELLQNRTKEGKISKTQKKFNIEKMMKQNGKEVE